jgi:hypothetical protein
MFCMGFFAGVLAYDRLRQHYFSQEVKKILDQEKPDIGNEYGQLTLRKRFVMGRNKELN